MFLTLNIFVSVMSSVSGAGYRLRWEETPWGRRRSSLPSRSDSVLGKGAGPAG